MQIFVFVPNQGLSPPEAGFVLIMQIFVPYIVYRDYRNGFHPSVKSAVKGKNLFLGNKFFSLRVDPNLKVDPN